MHCSGPHRFDFEPCFESNDEVQYLSSWRTLKEGSPLSGKTLAECVREEMKAATGVDVTTIRDGSQ